MDRLLKDYSYYLKVERAMSSNTVEAYLSDLQAFFDSGVPDALSVSPDDIISYLSGLDISERSQARLLSSLRSFFGWLQIEGERKDNPAENVDAPKIGRYLPSVLSVEEIDAIMDSVSLKDWKGLRDRCILEVLYACGLRVSEASSLRISDIFESEGFVRVTGKGDKQRIVPIGSLALSWIRTYLDSRPDSAPGYEDCLFINAKGRPLSRVSIFNLVKKQAMLAGIHKEISPHTFRHSFATHMIENGADLRVVQEMLGHESILTTEIYTHIDQSSWQKAVLDAHPDK
ncbi:MAG: tyrosine recombinase XerD [Bacteroidales bacterium]|nr:tyrosine recombinase XerD [Bacteroidales bacterium]